MTDDYHSGFGLFAKQHKEFFNALAPEDWTPVPGYNGVVLKELSGSFDHENKKGALTRISQWKPGAAVSEPVAHDWCEEVYLISGTLSIGTPDAEIETLQAGSYAVRPPHIPHGPFFTKDGCTMIEFLYYPPPAPTEP